jgi:hypothetical protein
MAGTNHLIGQAALILGAPESLSRRLADRGVIDVPRAGRVRVFPGDRLAEYRRALERGGYVRPAHPAAG